MEANQVFISRQMNKEDVVYIYSRLLFSMRKEILPFTTTCMGLESSVLSEITRQRQVPHGITHI